MGSYGIGLSRAVGAIAEQHHDERGLLWPDEVAPADVHVIAAGKQGQLEAAAALAAELVAGGLRVLVDDRPQLSAGVKFTDAELIGIRRIVVVGRRLSEGYAEVRDRHTDERRDVPLTDVVRALTG
jgi:prolyl-tRNA synthetase